MIAPTPLFFRNLSRKKNKQDTGVPQANADGVSAYAEVGDEEHRRIAQLFFRDTRVPTYSFFIPSASSVAHAAAAWNFSLPRTDENQNQRGFVRRSAVARIL